jgi:hypothetical protein
MDFYINKNSTLPVMKLDVDQDGLAAITTLTGSPYNWIITTT